jgi:hypothetical protein
MGNCTDVVFSFQVYIGSRGVVNLTGALPGMGLEGTGVTCDCDYMWTGPRVRTRARTRTTKYTASASSRLFLSIMSFF